MRKRIDEDSLFIAAAAVALPVLVLLLAMSKAPESFLNPVYSQMSDIDTLRERLSSGSIYVPNVLSDILTRRFYPSFIISLLIGGNSGKFLIRLFFYLRFGLMSLGMHMFCSGRVKLRNDVSLLLGLAYSISSVAIVASVDPQVMNIMIILPFALYMTENLMRTGTPKSFWQAAGIFTLFVTGGFLGVITGLLFVICAVPFLKSLMRTESGASRAFAAYAVSLPAQALVLIPVFASGPDFIDIKAEFFDSRMTFKFFDLLCSVLDGNPLFIPFAGSHIAMSLSVFVIVCVILFFMNRTIPYKAKLAGIILILVIPVSASWSLLNAILSVLGYTDTAAFLRIGILTVLLFVMAAVSLRNVSNCTRNGVFGAVGAVLALIILSNASNAGEVGKSLFYLWFSAGAALFSGVFLYVLKRERKALTALMAIIGAAGIGLNLWYSFSVSGLWGSFDSLTPYSGDNISGLNIDIDDSIPLYGDVNEYICVHSDMRQIASTGDFPGQINALSNAAAGAEVFTRAYSFAVFTDGVTDTGNGTYMVNTDTSYEILVRCENMAPSSNYYVFSSFEGDNTLTETYAGFDAVSSISGMYVKQLDRLTDAVSLRQIGAAPVGSAEFNVWRADSDAMAELYSSIYPLDDFSGTAIDDPSMGTYGEYSVITSIPYDGSYTIDVTTGGNTILSNTFNYGGRLAVSFFSHGASDYSFKIRSNMTVPVVSLIVWVLSIGVVIYNILRNRKSDESGRVELNVKQDD